MSDNAEENFRNLIGQGFGQMEAQVGTEAYQSMIELNKSAAESNRKHGQLADSQREYGQKMCEASIMEVAMRANFWRILARSVWLLVFVFSFGLIAWVVGMWQSVL